MVLTLQEKIEILTLTRNFSYNQTAEVFNQSHPHRPQPINKQTVARVVKYIRTRGSLERKKRTIPVEHQLDLTNQVHEIFDEDPHLSTRNAGRRLGVSHVTVWRVLKQFKFHPYKMSKHQKLHPDDPPKRKEFCQFLLDHTQANPGFHQSILWTDEKLFFTNGCFNRQNYR